MLSHKSIRFSVLFAVSVFVVSTGSITRVKDRIYYTLANNKQCFRILNGTHQVGCQSPESGSHGVLQLIESQDDIDYVDKDPGDLGPFIAAMGMEWFANKSAVMNLLDSGNVNGILVFLPDDAKSTHPFSEDVECPNDSSGLYMNDSDYGSCMKNGWAWNEGAVGYRFIDFKIPIFLINNKTEERILRNQCYERFNSRGNSTGSYPEYPVCSVELTMFQPAAGNAVRCKRRNSLFAGLDASPQLCDPLKGENVFAFIPATNKSRPLADKSVLMLATRMDSFSMFADYDPGAASSLGNVIVMLTIAEVLGRNQKFLADSSKNTGRYLMPVFFNGESLDYIGSSRMVYDILEKKFPAKLDNKTQDQPAQLSLNNLALILELNQVVSVPESGSYYFHVDQESMETPKTKAVVEKVMEALNSSIGSELSMVDNSSDVRILQFAEGKRLPPASVQRFLMADRSIPALVITDHEKYFENRHYNSFTDKHHNFDRDKAKVKMLNLANAVTKFMFDWISNESLGSLLSDWKVNETVMDIWMDCFWDENFTCPVLDRFLLFHKNFEKYGKPENNFERTYIAPFGRYLSTYIEYSMVYFLVVDRYLMPNKTTKCENSAFTNRTGEIYTYTSMVDLFDNSTNNTYCYKSSVSTSEALSPAFKISGYDFKSGNYSTWMESQWSGSSLRVYLRASRNWEGLVFGIGVIVMVLSIIVVNALFAGADTLFLLT